jgi:hypothetical protein
MQRVEAYLQALKTTPSPTTERIVYVAVNKPRRQKISRRQKTPCVAGTNYVVSTGTRTAHYRGKDTLDPQALKASFNRGAGN